jgi:hypothetical protein
MTMTSYDMPLEEVREILCQSDTATLSYILYAPPKSAPKSDRRGYVFYTEPKTDGSTTVSMLVMTSPTSERLKHRVTDFRGKTIETYRHYGTTNGPILQASVAYANATIPTGQNVIPTANAPAPVIPSQNQAQSGPSRFTPRPQPQPHQSASVPTPSYTTTTAHPQTGAAPGALSIPTTTNQSSRHPQRVRQSRWDKPGPAGISPADSTRGLASYSALPAQNDQAQVSKSIALSTNPAQPGHASGTSKPPTLGTSLPVAQRIPPAALAVATQSMPILSSTAPQPPPAAMLPTVLTNSVASSSLAGALQSHSQSVNEPRPSSMVNRQVILPPAPLPSSSASEHASLLENPITAASTRSSPLTAQVPSTREADKKTLAHDILRALGVSTPPVKSRKRKRLADDPIPSQPDSKRPTLVPGTVGGEVPVTMFPAQINDSSGRPVAVASAAQLMEGVLNGNSKPRETLEQTSPAASVGVTESIPIDAQSSEASISEATPLSASTTSVAAPVTSIDIGVATPAKTIKDVTPTVVSSREQVGLSASPSKRAPTSATQQLKTITAPVSSSAGTPIPSTPISVTPSRDIAPIAPHSSHVSSIKLTTSNSTQNSPLSSLPESPSPATEGVLNLVHISPSSSSAGPITAARSSPVLPLNAASPNTGSPTKEVPRGTISKRNISPRTLAASMDTASPLSTTPTRGVVNTIPTGSKPPAWVQLKGTAPSWQSQPDTESSQPSIPSALGKEASSTGPSVGEEIKQTASAATNHGYGKPLVIRQLQFPPPPSSSQRKKLTTYKSKSKATEGRIADTGMTENAGRSQSSGSIEVSANSSRGNWAGAFVLVPSRPQWVQDDLDREARKEGHSQTHAGSRTSRKEGV